VVMRDRDLEDTGRNVGDRPAKEPSTVVLCALYKGPKLHSAGAACLNRSTILVKENRAGGHAGARNAGTEEA
jgi:hypothetical protein